jgi:hypothetical protein
LEHCSTVLSDECWLTFAGVLNFAKSSPWVPRVVGNSASALDAELG